MSENHNIYGKCARCGGPLTNGHQCRPLNIPLDRDIHEEIKNNKQLDRWRRKAQPAAIERHSKACADIKEIWNTGGPVSWKVYELRLIRGTLPVAAMFEIDFLIGVLEC